MLDRYIWCNSFLAGERMPYDGVCDDLFGHADRHILGVFVIFAIHANFLLRSLVRSGCCVSLIQFYDFPESAS